MSTAPIDRVEPVPHATRVVPESLLRWIIALPLVAALGILLAHFALELSSSIVLIGYPFGADYGEGIVWQQMRNIMAGHGYAPLSVFPAIVYHYPPVFHVATGLLSNLIGSDELSTGRAISFLSTLATVPLVGLLAAWLGGSGKDRVAAIVGGATVGLIFLSCQPVAEWAPLMRVDMIALLFSMAGLVLALRATERPELLHFAALCFTLSVFSKQVSIAAPVAAFLGLVAVRPRLAMKLTVLTVMQSGLVLLLLSWLTHGYFLRHIILYNVNRMSPNGLSALIQPLRQQAIYIVLACAGAGVLCHRLVGLWRQRTVQPFAVACIVAALCYFILKTLMLVMIMKSGSSINYVVEWLGAVAILDGVAIVPAVEIVVRGFREGRIEVDRNALWAVVVLATIAFEAWSLPSILLTASNARASAAKAERIVQLIRHTPRPVISDDMTLLIRAGRPVQWEPSIAAELGATGRYDEPAFVKMVKAHRFGLFITEGDRGDPVYDSRYNPAVADAIATAYPREYRVDRFTIHAPEG